MNRMPFLAVATLAFFAIDRAESQTTSPQPAESATQERGAENVPEITEVSLHVTDTLPPVLEIRVKGKVGLGAYSNPRLKRIFLPVAPADGIQDFDFTATPPSGAAITVISEITASELWDSVVLDAPWLKGIRVRGRGTGVKEFQLADDQIARLRGVRAFIGVSESRSLDEAVRNGLSRLDQAMSEGPVADGMVNWQMGSVSGTVGGFAGIDELKVIIYATRTPPWE